MSSIESALARWRPGELDLVLHLGAGAGDELDCYAALKIGRAVLVEGDPQAAAALREAANGHPWAEVLERVVSADGRDSDWHRYNLPALNGLAEAQDVQHIFPRLRRESVVRLPTTTLDTVMADAKIPAEGRSVLVLDMHGIDARILDKAQDRLQCFEVVVLRGTLRAGAQAEGLVENRLRAAGFVPDLSGDDDALWPIQRWNFDRLAFESRALRRRLDECEAALGAGREELTSARAGHQRDLEVARRSAEETQAALARERELAANLLRDVEGARRSADAARGALAGERERATGLEQELEGARRYADDVQAVLARERELAAHLERELESARHSAEEALAALAHERERAASLARDVESARRSVEESQAVLSREEQRCRELQTQQKSLTDEHEQASRSAKARLEQALESQERLGRERAEVDSAVLKHLADIEVLKTALSEAKLEAVAHAAETEELRRQGVARDQLQRDLEQVLQDRQARIRSYVEKLSVFERERDTWLMREQLLREELLQAEAQIELVKDVVLRESES